MGVPFWVLLVVPGPSREAGPRPVAGWSQGGPRVALSGHGLGIVTAPAVGSRPPFDDVFNVPELEYGTRELLCCRYSNPDRLRRDLGELLRFL